MEIFDKSSTFVSNCTKTAPVVAYDPEKRVVLCSSLEIKKGHSLSQEEKLQKTGEQENPDILFLCRLYECDFFRIGSCRHTKAAEFSVLK